MQHIRFLQTELKQKNLIIEQKDVLIEQLRRQITTLYGDTDRISTQLKRQTLIKETIQKLESNLEKLDKPINPLDSIDADSTPVKLNCILQNSIESPLEKAKTFSRPKHTNMAQLISKTGKGVKVDMNRFDNYYSLIKQKRKFLTKTNLREVSSSSRTSEKSTVSESVESKNVDQLRLSGQKSITQSARSFKRVFSGSFHQDKKPSDDKLSAYYRLSAPFN